MLLAGVSGLSIAIMADFWQPEKNEKSGIDQILTPACCPRQYKHIAIKNVAYNHVTAISELCKKAKSVVLHLLLLHTFYFHAISQEQLQIQTQIIPH